MIFSSLGKVDVEDSGSPQKIFGMLNSPRTPLDEYSVSAIVVCHNLLKITITCIDHVRSSSVVPEIVLVDNGSSSDVMHWAMEEQSKDKSFVYVRNNHNLGCAIGRNQGSKWSSGTHLLFLDNDQFIPPDLIKRLVAENKDLVGIEVWNVTDKDGSVQRGSPASIGPNSYIGAGGMMVKRGAFLSLGGFDERYAPAWYEDADFAFRARAAGYSMVAIQHSKVVHLGNKTSESQKTYDSDLVKSNSRALFSGIWGKAIEGKEKVPKEGVLSLSRRSSRFGKPWIIMLVDVPGWAWDNKAKQVARYLDNFFYFTIIYRSDPRLEQILKSKGIGIVFTFEVNFFSMIVNCVAKKITGVTAHTYVNFDDYAHQLGQADAIHANSLMLLNEIRTYNKHYYYLPNGVDEEMFPCMLFNGKGRDIIAGYVGKDKPRKGLRSYIEPACKKAGVVLTPQAGKVDSSCYIQHNCMPSYYSTVDVIMVASDMDGTPNQLLEAASCGRAAIANRIGNTPEFIENGRNGFLVDRDIEAYAEKLRWLKVHKAACERMGKEARKTVEKGWTWKLQAENYKRMFLEVLG